MKAHHYKVIARCMGLLITFYLTGCANQQASYSCNQFPTAGCVPVSQVYDRVDLGLLEDYRSSGSQNPPIETNVNKPDLRVHGVTSYPFNVSNDTNKPSLALNNMEEDPPSTDPALGQMIADTTPLTTPLQIFANIPQLSEPRTLRILIQPWIDDDQDFHSGGYVHILLEASQWVLP
jgi:type IV conjugative transfer system lipoprotein TraV